MKSLAMLNLNRLSPNADLCSEIKALDMRLEIINKNVLYITHLQDKILKLVKELGTDSGLQKQVDEYFEDDETSPQTESVEHSALNGPS